MKSCKDCGQTKPLDQFYRHPKMRDGYLNKCRDCVCQRVRKHRRQNDHVREYDRERAKRPERIKHRAEVTQRWREQYPERAAAHNAVSNAVRDGKLDKEPCYFCGEERVEAHHPDYTKPLDVVWLCARCHRRLHALESAA